jgi:hypothetical protein
MEINLTLEDYLLSLGVATICAQIFYHLIN